MLLQAIAAARVGQHLIREGAQIQFFVVAIYLCANLTAERYVVANIGQGKEVRRSVRCLFFSQKRQVHIAQKDFDLATADSAVAFLREMYNLVAVLAKLAEHLDEDKLGRLCGFKDATSKVISLTSKAKEKRSD